MLDVRHSHLGYFGGQLAAILSATLSLRNVLLVLLFFLTNIVLFLSIFKARSARGLRKEGIYMKKVSRMFRKPWGTVKMTVYLP